MRFRSVLPVLALAMALVGLTPVGSQALSPNNSLLLWKPGRAHTGVLKDGVYTRKRSFVLKGVSLAAASRSSLALYTKDTGRLRTGTFRSGVFTPVESIAIRSGFTHMAASCDTLILYNTDTGRLLVGTLNGGRFRNRTTSIIEDQFTNLMVDCDLAVLSRDEYIERVAYRTGAAVGGDLVLDDLLDVPLDPVIRQSTTTTTAFLALDGAGFGFWGHLEGYWYRNADSSAHRYTDTFGTWPVLAGTASTILFLNNAGIWCAWTMSLYDLAGQTCGDGELGKGWKVGAGGR